MFGKGPTQEREQMMKESIDLAVKGYILKEEGKTKEASEYFLQAAKISEKLQDYGTAMECYRESGMYEDAARMQNITRTEDESHYEHFRKLGDNIPHSIKLGQTESIVRDLRNALNTYVGQGLYEDIRRVSLWLEQEDLMLMELRNGKERTAQAL